MSRSRWARHRNKRAGVLRQRQCNRTGAVVRVDHSSVTMRPGGPAIADGSLARGGRNREVSAEGAARDNGQAGATRDCSLRRLIKWRHRVTAYRGALVPKLLNAMPAFAAKLAAASASALNAKAIFRVFICDPLVPMLGFTGNTNLVGLADRPTKAIAPAGPRCCPRAACLPQSPRPHEHSPVRSYPGVR